MVAKVRRVGSNPIEGESEEVAAVVVDEGKAGR